MGVAVEHMYRDAKARTLQSKVMDLSGAADIDTLNLDSNVPMVIDNIEFVYTEASSANTGVTLKAGHSEAGAALDDDSLCSQASEVSIGIYTRRAQTLLSTLVKEGIETAKPILPANSVIVVQSAGGKTGAGEGRWVVTAFPWAQTSDRYC